MTLSDKRAAVRLIKKLQHFVDSTREELEISNDDFGTGQAIEIAPEIKAIGQALRKRALTLSVKVVRVPILLKYQLMDQPAEEHMVYARLVWEEGDTCYVTDYSQLATEIEEVIVDKISNGTIPVPTLAEAQEAFNQEIQDIYKQLTDFEERYGYSVSPW